MKKRLRSTFDSVLFKSERFGLYRILVFLSFFLFLCPLSFLQLQLDLFRSRVNNSITFVESQNLDTIIGIQGKNFVLLASDSLFYRSGIVMKDNDDKIIQLDATKLLAIGGPTYMVDILVNWFKSMLRLIQLQQYRISRVVEKPLLRQEN